MSDYERLTPVGIQEVFRKADEIFAERASLRRTRESRHAVTYAGGEGTVTVDAHRHGPYTAVVISTNQLRTSKIDIVTRHLMNQLPYQPGDPARSAVG